MHVFYTPVKKCHVVSKQKNFRDHYVPADRFNSCILTLESAQSKLLLWFWYNNSTFLKVLHAFSAGLIRLMHGQMAETTKEEVDGGNEVNDPSEWDDDATKGLKNSGEQMESPVKEKSLGVLKSFRRSLKGFSPKTQKDKRSENTDDQTSNSPLRSPHSPSKCITTRHKKVLLFFFCDNGFPRSVVYEVKQKLCY